jgi:hypothetical protein
VRIEVFEYGVVVAEGISKGVREPCFARILSVENYRYNVVLGVHFG